MWMSSISETWIESGVLGLRPKGSMGEQRITVLFKCVLLFKVTGLFHMNSNAPPSPPARQSHETKLYMLS